MRRTLTSVISLYWAVAFALLAAASLRFTTIAQAAPAGQFQQILKPLAANELLATGFAAGSALVSAIFVWSVATSALERSGGWSGSDDVARTAFSSAVTLLAAVLVSAAFTPTEGVVSGISIQMAALAACYAAVVSEGRLARRFAQKRANDRREAITQMALGAAHQSLLPRLFSGRPSGERRGG